MVDFVEEVEEQLRAERLAGFVKQAWPWLAAALGALIVGWLGVWGYRVWRDHNIDVASAAYEKGLQDLVAGDQTGAYNAFEPIASHGPGAYRALALMQQADLRASADKAEEAAALYDKAAAAAPNAVIGDLARLRAALVLMDSTPFAQIDTRLKAIIGDKKPFTLEAREALAMAKLQAGRGQEARGDLSALSLTLGVTPEMRGRLQSAIGLIDSGQSAAAAGAVRTAATLPPQDPASLASILGAPNQRSAGQGPASSPAPEPASGASQ